MALINDMIVDENGGVCLRKNLHYYTYDTEISGCTCYEYLIEVDENIYTGDYVLPYVNTNDYFTINTGDTSVCLNISPTTMSSWFESYVNLLATTGYNGYLGSEKENRTILSNGSFYKIEHITGTCEQDIVERNAIINRESNEIWLPESNEDFFYDGLTSCGEKSGDRYVKLMNINPFSKTYNEIQIIDKCKNETSPLVETIGSTSTGLITGNIVSNGGYDITESGICYSFNRNPLISDNKIISNNVVLGNYQCQLTEIKSETYYYYRAYAKNVIGVGYGEQLIYTPITHPTIKIKSIYLDNSDNIIIDYVYYGFTITPVVGFYLYSYDGINYVSSAGGITSPKNIGNKNSYQNKRIYLKICLFDSNYYYSDVKIYDNSI